MEMLMPFEVYLFNDGNSFDFAGCWPVLLWA